MKLATSLILSFVTAGLVAPGCGSSHADSLASGGATGANSSASTTGSSGSGSGSSGSISCTPADQLCVGSTVYKCLLSGKDASEVIDCASIPTNAGDSTENPFGCFTNHCTASSIAPGTGACCRKTQPTCVSDVTSNAAFSFSSWDVSGSPLCNRGNFSAGVGDSEPLLYVTDQLPSGDSVNVILPLLKSVIAPGGSASIASLAAGAGNAFMLELKQGSASCSSWQGTVYFDTDIPSWKVRLDLTCAAGGGLALAGTFSGLQ
jgi:hypothetical protein